MKLKLQMAVMACAALSVPAHAQSISTYRATVNGSNSDSGKCTIEVVVDGIAEIEVRGDQGRMRTVTGQPAQWRRFQCDGMIPVNMSDFHFKGVDGRGRVQLVTDPRNNRGVAMVRIEDPQGGSEGYTFDLEWRGGSGSSGGGWSGDRGSGWGSDRSNVGAGEDWRSGNRGSGYGWGSGGGSGWGNGAGWAHNDRLPEAIRACQDSLRDRAQRDGYVDMRFRSANAESNAGRRDRITGTLDVRTNNNRVESFNYSCEANFGNGTISRADVRR